MNLYDIFMYPLEKLFLTSMRKQLITKSSGDVLEIGAGTGVNFKYYDDKKVASITAIDKEINKAAERKGLGRVKSIVGDAANLPFEDDSFDTVIETLMLCSVNDEQAVLKEIKRVLKPDGIFVHIDHGMPKKRFSRKLFDFLAPAWKACSKSCRINKEIKSIIHENYFASIDKLSRGGGVFYGGISKISE